MEQNRQITKENKIFAIVIEIRETVFLSVQYASCLEEAFAQSKLEFERINPLIKPKLGSSGAKIGLFTIKSVEELTEENFNFNNNRAAHQKLEEEEMKKIIPGPSVKNFLNPAKVMEKIDKLVNESKEEISIIKTENLKKEKNLLMAKILKEGNEKIFKEFKALLTKEEQLYIREQLDKN